jgi:beta-lactamase regulating signal transducer with metallopeptidase domain/TolA-binding protein
MERLLELGLSNAACAAVLAVLVAAGACLCRRPALVHGLWILVLLKLVTPPLYPVHLHWAEQTPVRSETKPDAEMAWNEPSPGVLPDLDTMQPPTESVPREATEEMVPQEATESAESQSAREWVHAVSDQPVGPRLGWPSWQLLTGVVWLVASCSWLILAGTRVGRFQRLLRLARPAPEAVQSQARELAARLRLPRCPLVSIVPASISPMLAVLVGKPRLLVPEQLWQRLNEAQRLTLLAHELAHYKRGDHWVRRLELAVAALYWWHPVVWWARRQIREAEEACCDAWVVFLSPEAVESYATALVETVAFLSQTRPAMALAASGIGYVASLRRRLTMIMRGTTPQALSAAGFLLLVALGLLILPLVPTWAEADPQEPADAPAVASDGQASTTAPLDSAVQRGINWLNRTQRTAGMSVQEVRDEINVLRSQVVAKESELQEARAMVRQAERALGRAQSLHKTGAVPVEDLDQLETNAEVQRARLRGKEAQVAEARARLVQGEHRLAQLRGGDDRPRTSASADFEPRLVPPARARSSVTTGADTAPATSSGAVIAAPRAATRASTGTTSSSSRTTSGTEGQGRLARLEEKLDALLRDVGDLRQQMDRLHKELRRQQSGLSPQNQPLHLQTTPEDQRFQALFPAQPDGAIERKLVPNQDHRGDPRNTPTVPLNKPH